MTEATTTTTTTTAAATTTPWYAGKAPENMVGHWQNRGLPANDPAELAIKVSEQYLELEKLRGVPADRLIKLPEANDEAGWKGVWSRLGAPKEAKDYDLSSVKMNGNDADPALLDAMRAAMFAASIPTEKGLSIVKAAVKFLEDKDKAALAESTAKEADQWAALKKNWGQNENHNTLVADEGARRLGVSPDEVKAMGKVIGIDRVAELFRKIGAGTQEAGFRVAPNGAGGDVTTQEGAKARLQELQEDSEWRGRFLKGGLNEKREFHNLTRLAAGVVGEL